MIATARAVSEAANLPHAAGEGGDNLLRAVYGHLLAGADGGDPRGFITTSASRCLAAALKGVRAGTQVSCAAGTGTVADPAAVARGTVVAFGLAAALYVRCVPRTGTIDGSTPG